MTMIDRNKGLKYSFEQRDGYVVVHLVGDLNMFSAPELRTQLVAKLDSGVLKFIINLTELTFVDSSGIGILVSFVSLTKKKTDSKVILCGLNQQIRNIFEVTRLISVFNVLDTIEDASAQLKH